MADDEWREKARRLAEEIGVDPDLLEASVDDLLAKSSHPSRPSGRPKGTGGDFSAALDRMADLVIGSSKMTFTRASDIVAAEWSQTNRGHVSASHLRHLYSPQQGKLEEKARSRKRWAALPDAEKQRLIREATQAMAATYGPLAEQIRKGLEPAPQLAEVIARAVDAAAHPLRGLGPSALAEILKSRKKSAKRRAKNSPTNF